MVKIGGKKKTDEEIINYPTPDYIEDELDLLPTAPKRKVKPKLELLSPDDLFAKIRSKYNIPISITRKELESTVVVPNDDHQEYLIRYKRSKRDFDLYYGLLQEYLNGTLVFDERKA